MLMKYPECGINYISRNEWLAWAVAIGGISVLAAGVVHHQEGTRAPVKVFTAEFTDEGGCLDGTPYDPDMGASLYSSSIDGTETLSVIPRDANTQTPSVLFLAVDQTDFHQPELYAADYATGGYLHDAECSDQSGY